MPQNRIIYALILLFALALLGSALATLQRVRLSGEGVSSRDTFDLPKEPRQRPLFLPQFGEPVPRDGKKAAVEYFKKQKEWEKSYAGSPAEERIIRDYKKSSPQKRMFLLMKARRTGDGKGYGAFFLYVYQNSSQEGRRQVALSGLAVSDPERAVKIVKRDIFGKEDSGYSWQYHGLSVLFSARSDEAKNLLAKIAAAHPDSRVASKAREYGRLLKRISGKGRVKLTPLKKKFLSKTP